MKIGIISDTHDQIDNIHKAIDLFNKEKVYLVYHLGDWCAPFSMMLFENLNCHLKSVFGNNDADIFKHLKFKPDNVNFFDNFYVDEIEGKKICLIHGDPETLVEDIFDSKKYDLLLRGHNHKAEIKRNEKTLMINPGNLLGDISMNDKDPLFNGWTEPSVAIYDFEKDEARIINL